MLVTVLAVYLVALTRGHTDAGVHEEYVRALTFTALVIANLGLILANLSWTRSIVSVLRDGNRALWWVLGGAALFLAAALYIPQIRGVFRFAALAPADLVLAAAAGALSILWFEVVKLFSRRRRRPVG